MLFSESCTPINSHKKIKKVLNNGGNKTSSGSDVRIKGTTINHTASASSGSSIDAFALKSDHANASASSGASINIYASIKMDGKATSGADIDFKGNPAAINKETSSGGSISMN